MTDFKAPPTPEAADYLWDPAAAPDPEIQRLEQVLSVYRHRRSAPELPAPAPIPLPTITTVRPGRARLAAAAMILLAGAAALFAHRPQAAWDLTTLSGAAPGSVPVAQTGRLRAGEWFRTDDQSTVKLDIPGLGHVDVEPDTTIRIASGAGKQRRLELQQGSIHAYITAPPRLFVVTTPAARAVDMGCEYRLEVDSDGTGELRVLLGWVYLQDAGLESRVPMAGGRCLIRPGFGPGTPFFEDASPAFKDALSSFDFGGRKRGALATILTSARPHDALSLWHLLSRTAGRDRAAVFDRLGELKTLPDTVSRQRVVALDPGALEELWDAMRPF